MGSSTVQQAALMLRAPWQWLYNDGGSWRMRLCIAALVAGGRTIAVLGSGLLNIYPPEHAELALEVSRAGALLSEAPVKMGPHRTLFPQRNRLISGLSRGVIVIEASAMVDALLEAQGD